MGFPIMKALFGNDAVFYTALFNILFNLEVFTLGVILINYGNDVKMKLNPKNLLSPGVISSVIAIFIYFLEIPVPDVLANCCEMVGDMTTPLAMMIIGATLANIKIKDLFNYSSFAISSRTGSSSSFSIPNCFKKLSVVPYKIGRPTTSSLPDSFIKSFSKSV